MRKILSCEQSAREEMLPVQKSKCPIPRWRGTTAAQRRNINGVNKLNGAELRLRAEHDSDGRCLVRGRDPHSDLLRGVRQPSERSRSSNGRVPHTDQGHNGNKARVPQAHQPTVRKRTSARARGDDNRAHHLSERRRTRTPVLARRGRCGSVQVTRVQNA